MGPRTACDRCRAIKGRCLSGVPGGRCYRCARLHHTCIYSTSSTQKSDSITTPGIREEWRAPTLLAQGLTEISGSVMTELCCFFSIGPTLSSWMQQTLWSHFLDAPALLMEPYLAVNRAFKRATMGQPVHNDADLQRCAKGLRSLRQARLKRVEDARRFLLLGLCLLTFQRFIGGFTASTICRTTLALVCPWADTLANDPATCMELHALQFLDTTQCLFRRQVPILKCPERDLKLVHRSAGICGRLLPLLYRVCLAGAALHSNNQSIPSPGSMDSMWAEIEAWCPYLPGECMKTMQYTEMEVTALLSQASAYRATALLILHRLQYPFGQRDQMATTLARAIISELKHCLCVTGQYPPHTALPLVMAGVEAACGAERDQIHILISSLRGAAFYPNIPHLRELLASVWMSRDSGDGQNVFDLFDQHPTVNRILL